MKTSYKNIIPFVLGTGMLGACASGDAVMHNGLARYVVTDKSDNKIIFENVSGKPTQRVMTFAPSDSVYYQNIHVMDTLGCTRAFYDNELVVPVSNAEIRLISQCDMFELAQLYQQTQLRDSLINTMKYKQK